jgi:hypothetical protein
MASKKQLNELESIVVLLEERLEKVEEEHKLMKQMLSMQNSLIDNLQMMVKVLSVPATLLPTEPSPSVITSSPVSNQAVPTVIQIGGSSDTKQDVKHRMARVV